MPEQRSSPRGPGRRRFLQQGAGVVATLLLPGLARAAATGDEAVDTLMAQAIASGTLSGAGLLLCAADGIRFRRAYGDYTVDTRQLIASATKLASATAIMSVIDAGLLQLDDTIGRHLPGFGPNRRAITVRQLLAQTHGLPAAHPAIAPPHEDNGLTLAQAVDRIATDDSLEFAPGSRHRYEPAVAYHIAGRICEVVTGKPWAALFGERVAAPLGMTTFDYGATRNPRIGGGGMTALDDYGALIRMHLSGGLYGHRQVLSTGAVRQMQTDQLHGAPFTPLPMMEAHGYGLTWWFNRLTPAGAPRLLTVPGAFGAIPWIDLAGGTGGFLLVRSRLRTAVELFERLQRVVEG